MCQPLRHLPADREVNRSVEFERLETQLAGKIHQRLTQLTLDCVIFVIFKVGQANRDDRQDGEEPLKNQLDANSTTGGAAPPALTRLMTCFACSSIDLFRRAPD